MGREREPKHIPDRKIDTWYYDVKDLTIPVDEEGFSYDEDDAQAHEDAGKDAAAPAGSRVVTKKVEVDLYLCKHTSSSDTPPYPLKDVDFEVRCKEPKFCFKGTEIEVLRAAAWAKLDEKYAVQWHPYFLVTVSSAHGFGGGISRGLEMSYDTVYKGITWDGKFLLKQYARFHGETVIKPWPGRFVDKGGHAIACIPRNEVNEQALDEFHRRIEKLRELMTDHLRPERIEATLANLAGLALLPPAPPQETNGQD